MADIADKLGFEEHTHFTQFFSRHMGVPPSEFRRRSVVLGAPLDQAIARLCTP